MLPAVKHQRRRARISVGWSLLSGFPPSVPGLNLNTPTRPSSTGPAEPKSVAVTVRVQNERNGGAPVPAPAPTAGHHRRATGEPPQRLQVSNCEASGDQPKHRGHLSVCGLTVRPGLGLFLYVHRRSFSRFWLFLSFWVIKHGFLCGANVF